MPLPPRQDPDPAHAHLSGHVCAICDDGIRRGETYFAGELTPQVAAQLLDVDRPELVPAWRQLPDGKVRLSICAACRSEMNPALPVVAAVA